MRFSKVACYFVIVFCACTCFAQMYTVMDLGTLGGTYSTAYSINDSGQVVGSSGLPGDSISHAFRTAPNTRINPATDDLGSLGGTYTAATSINNSGQVVGFSSIAGDSAMHAFRTAPNSRINPATDDLGTLGGSWSYATSINASGQVVGYSSIAGDADIHAFRTAPNSRINPATDDLGTSSYAYGINDSGQVVGSTGADVGFHAFRTAPNSRINPATDDLGTLGGSESAASAINNFGQVFGNSFTSGDVNIDVFRTAPNNPINPATDDLGSLGGTFINVLGVNDWGEFVGWGYTTPPPYFGVPLHAYLYSIGPIQDLNNLIAAGAVCVPLGYPGAWADINDAGQIVAEGVCGDEFHAFLLTPIYKGFVQQPINADGTSLFSARRGVVPVKFAVMRYGTQPSCSLAATISIIRASGTTLVPVDENIYATTADSGSNFRIDSAVCQYIYNLSASSLGVGTYRVDISLNGIMVGHAVLALK